MRENETRDHQREIIILNRALQSADAILVGVGAGMSTSAGFLYEGPRFTSVYPDFIEKYGFTDYYSAGFYPFPSLEEYWAFWSRMILVNRYDLPIGKPYEDLLTLLHGRNYFVITTNVDHRFQAAGIDKERLFYTQGDYGLLQCPVPCHPKTYDNEELIRRMVAEQRGMKIPTDLIPHCPRCNAPMTTNLRSDDRFVEDEGWHSAKGRYVEFVESNREKAVLILELGVGYNTPGIIKYPFMKMTVAMPKSQYISINPNHGRLLPEIEDRSLLIQEDIGIVLSTLLEYNEIYASKGSADTK